jgi:hypothetical protein
MKNITPEEALAALCLTIDSYTEEYAFEAESEEGDVAHTPNDFEMRLIEDAIQGLISEPEFVRDFIAWQLTVMRQLKSFERDPLVNEALRILGGAVNAPAPSVDMFLVVASGENYETKLCRQDQVVEAIAGMIYEHHEDMPPEERDQWTEDINDKTKWDESHPDLGPTHFRCGIGETGWIDVWRVVHDPNTHYPTGPIPEMSEAK